MSLTYNSEELVTYPKGYDPVLPTTQPAWQVFGDGHWNAVSLLTANDQIRLVNKLTEKLQGSDFNASVFLGEGHQSLRMIGDNAIKIAKALHHTRKGDFGGALRTLLEDTGRKPLPRLPDSLKVWAKGKSSNVASRWLELQYGWKPLLGDCWDAAQSLAHILNTPLRTTYRVRVGKELNWKTVRQWPVYGPGQFGTSTAGAKQRHDRYLVAKISEDPNGLPSLLGLTHPELVAWELLPYSFVADWFLPIGDWLQARSLVSRLKGTFITSDLQVGKAFPPQSGLFDHAPRCHNLQVVMNRTISSVLDVPMPSFKPLGKALSVQHCLNGLALLTNAFAGGRAPRG